MSKQHKGWKGCCMMCADWFRGEDKHKRYIQELRSVGGRRGQRHKLWKRRRDDE